MVCQRWWVTKWCERWCADGVSKMVGDKVVCEGWCVKEGVSKMVCDKVVCERWCVTKWCVKDGV